MSIQPPKADGSDYSPKHAAEIDRLTAQAAQIDVRGTADADQAKALRALVQVLSTALKIAYERHYDGKPEPYPGAAKKVIEQARKLIETARSGGLLGER